MSRSWRMMRDYFDDRGMHGLIGMRSERYEPLVERVTERNAADQHYQRHAGRAVCAVHRRALR